MPWSEIAAVLVAAVAGYAMGSVPVAATFEAGRGPGWRLLAVTADLAKGVLPVALATVTWSWTAGWAAGLGAVAGTCWPALGRAPGRLPGAVLAAAAFALAPPAGMIAALVALAVAGAARLVRRDGRLAALAVGVVGYTLLFAVAYRDPARLVALLALPGVAVLRSLVTHRA